MNTNSLPVSALSGKEKTFIAQRFLNTLREKDLEVLSGMFTENATWKIPGSNALSGVAVGMWACVECAESLTDFALSFHLKNIQCSYSGFALSLQLQAPGVDKVLDQCLTFVVTLLDDKISAIDTYIADLDMMNVFFGGAVSHQKSSVTEPATHDYQLTIANTFLSAMKSNNWDLMRFIMEPDLQWTLPGKSLLSGPAVCVDAVIHRAQSLKKFGVMFELLNIVYGWDSVALSLHNTGRRDNLILDEYVTIQFHLGESKISGMVTHLSDVPGIEAFFVPGIISKSVLI